MKTNNNKKQQKNQQNTMEKPKKNWNKITIKHSAEIKALSQSNIARFINREFIATLSTY